MSKSKKPTKEELEAMDKYSQEAEDTLNEAIQDAVAYGYGLIVVDSKLNLNRVTPKEMYDLLEGIANAKSKSH